MRLKWFGKGICAYVRCLVVVRLTVVPHTRVFVFALEEEVGSRWLSMPLMLRSEVQLLEQRVQL